MTRAPLDAVDVPSLTCRLVYWGPAGAGKQATLRAVFDGTIPERRDTLRSAVDGIPGARRLDFLALELGELSGRAVQLHLRALPGSPYHQATRRRALASADGVIFVVDPQVRCVNDVLASWRELHEALAARGEDPRTFPLVLQYGKQDLPSTLCRPIAAWEALLNGWAAPAYPVVAIRGEGVFDVLRAVTALALARRARLEAAATAAGGAS